MIRLTDCFSTCICVFKFKVLLLIVIVICLKSNARVLHCNAPFFGCDVLFGYVKRTYIWCRGSCINSCKRKVTHLFFRVWAVLCGQAPPGQPVNVSFLQSKLCLNTFKHTSLTASDHSMTTPEHSLNTSQRSTDLPWSTPQAPLEHCPNTSSACHRWHRIGIDDKGQATMSHRCDDKEVLLKL